METGGGSIGMDTDVDVLEIPPPEKFGSNSRSMKQKSVLQHEVIQIDIDEDSSDDIVGASNRGKTVSDFCNGSNSGKGKETSTVLQKPFQSSSSSGLVSHGSNHDADVLDLTSDDEDDYSGLFDLEDYEEEEEDTNTPWLLRPSLSQEMQVNFISSSHSDIQMNSSNHHSASLADGFSSNGHGSKRIWNDTQQSAKPSLGSNLWKSKKQFSANSSFNYDYFMGTDEFDMSSGLQKRTPFWQDPTQVGYDQSGNVYFLPCKDKSVSLASHPQATTSKPNHNVDEGLKELGLLKQFDTVDDCSDHHYLEKGILLSQPHRGWMRAIQDEWKMLQKDLPETIFVRVYETRIDLMRAAMVGPQGTPYHDGLFFFDVFFPPLYPTVPPNVYYHSGGLRLNPNLYATGKVCLSLLNTWTGTKYTEKWIPGTSNMLQVLVSIQALILNEKPYFNEPGYEVSMGTPDGEKMSLQYSEDTYKKSLQTMLYTMKKPHKHFKELITSHFCNHAHAILEACKTYMDGAQVGSFVRGTKPDSGKKCNSKTFKSDIAGLSNLLVTELTRIGANDCEKFIVPNAAFQMKGQKPADVMVVPTMTTKLGSSYSKPKKLLFKPK